MGSPVVHFEIRSSDPVATRAFYGKRYGWTYVDSGMPATPTSSPTPSSLPAPA
jgi:predicted enzyme related to lactoylglutathione lyase